MERSEIEAKLQEISLQLRDDYYSSILTRDIFNWEDLYKQCLQSQDWKKKTQAIKARDGQICRFCNEGPADEVHHMTYRNLGRESEFELISVCKPCHDLIHGIEIMPDATEINRLEKFKKDVPLDETNEILRGIKAENVFANTPVTLIQQVNPPHYKEADCKSGSFGNVWIYFVQNFSNVKPFEITLDGLATLVIRIGECDDIEIRVDKSRVTIEFFSPPSYKTVSGFGASLRTDLKSIEGIKFVQFRYPLVAVFLSEKSNPYHCFLVANVVNKIDDLLSKENFWKGFERKTSNVYFPPAK